MCRPELDDGAPQERGEQSRTNEGDSLQNPAGLRSEIFEKGTIFAIAGRETDVYSTETSAADATLAAHIRVASVSAVPSQVSDAALIARVASGDRVAMHALFARHHTQVYRFVLRLLRDADTAEDVTSEVFLAVWRHAHKFEGRSTGSTWFLAIARFKALAELRRRRNAEPQPTELEASDPAADPEECCAEKSRGAVLRKCLGMLSAEHRTIIDLVYYHEKSVPEVAAIVGIPGATVKTRMFYARKKLDALLAANGVTRAAA